MNLNFEPYIINDSDVPNVVQFFNNICYSLMLFPFIFVSSKDKIKQNSRFTYEQIINHEKIHFNQCIETGVIGFYLIYILEVLCNYIKFGNVWDAYINVRFEQEAYNNMGNLDYLNDRKLYSWRDFTLFPDNSYNIEAFLETLNNNVNLDEKDEKYEKDNVEEENTEEDKVEEDNVEEENTEEDKVEEDNVKEDDLEEDNVEEDDLEEDNVEEDDLEEDNVEEDKVVEDDVDEDTNKENVFIRSSTTERRQLRQRSNLQ